MSNGNSRSKMGGCLNVRASKLPFNINAHVHSVEYWIRLNETNSDVRMYTLIIYFICWRTCSM